MNYTTMLFRNLMTICGPVVLMIIAACSDPTEDTVNPPEVKLSEQNLRRAMELTDNAIASHFTGDGMAMARYYNPYSEVRSEEKGSVWMYTSAMEAVNAVLLSLEAQKE